MRNKSAQQKMTPKQGFSLVELMVALTLFSIIMISSIGTLITMVDANAKAQALYSVMTDMSFVVDSMTRNIRTAHEHYCFNDSYESSAFNDSGSDYPVNDCSGELGIAFTADRGGERIGYRYNSDDESIEQRTDDGEWIRMTSETVKITNLEFIVSGTDDTDDVQPRIFLVIEGKVENGLDVATTFKLQTNVVQYVIDV